MRRGQRGRWLYEGQDDGLVDLFFKFLLAGMILA